MRFLLTRLNRTGRGACLGTIDAPNSDAALVLSDVMYGNDGGTLVPWEWDGCVTEDQTHGISVDCEADVRARLDMWESIDGEPWQ